MTGAKVNIFFKPTNKMKEKITKKQKKVTFSAFCE
jgi:hypothetical protein